MSTLCRYYDAPCWLVCSTSLHTTIGSTPASAIHLYRLLTLADTTQYSFVVTFKTVADRDCAPPSLCFPMRRLIAASTDYLDTDPAHVEFKNSLAGKIAKATVLDFEPGVF